MAKMTGFIFQDEYLERLAKLSDQELGRLVRALAIYHATGEQQELAGRESIAYDFIKVDIDRIDEKYAAKCDTNRNNRQRSSTNDNERERTMTNVPKDKDKDKVKEKDIKENDLSVIKEKRQRFSPPTADEVKAYCQERENHVDPQRFVDFYTAKGWRVGNNPMKDWKAAVRTWEQRDNITPLNTGQTYTQRQYSEADLEARITEL
jgi:hypothetical protein